MEINRKTIDYNHMWMPLTGRVEVEEILGKVCELKGISGEALSEMVEKFHKKADDKKIMHHVLCLVPGGDIRTDIQVQVWEINDRGDFIISLSSRSEDLEKSVAELTKKRRGLGWIRIAGALPIEGAAFTLNCDDIIAMIKKAALSVPDDLTGTLLAEKLVGEDLSYGIPFIPLYSDGIIQVTVTLDDPENKASMSYSALEKWKREGAVISGELVPNLGKDDPGLSVILHVMRDLSRKSAYHSVIWEEKDTERAQEMAERIFSVF